MWFIPIKVTIMVYIGGFEDIQQSFDVFTIPAQTCVKFMSSLGKMATVCINIWKNIWKMNVADLGRSRVYIADFEIYNEQSQNPEQAVLYMGIRKWHKISKNLRCTEKNIQLLINRNVCFFAATSN